MTKLFAIIATVLVLGGPCVISASTPVYAVSETDDEGNSSGGDGSSGGGGEVHPGGAIPVDEDN